MVISVERDPSKERLDQIADLEEWAKRNTIYDNISPLEIVKFFDSNKENLSKDLEHVSKMYFDMVEWTKSKFKLGKFTAMEYANAVLLRKTEGHDIEEMRSQIRAENVPLIRPILSNSAKISIMQDTVSQIMKETSESEIPQTKLVERLVNSGAFVKEEITEFIQNAVKMGALVTTKPGYLSI